MPDYDDVVDRADRQAQARIAAADAHAAELLGRYPRTSGDQDQPPADGGLLSWGDIVFAAGAGLARLRRVAEYRHPAIERIGLPPVRQALGPGVETVTLAGVIHPAWAGGPSTIQTLRSAAASGDARLLTDGRGAVLGRWAVLRVEESWSALHSDGRPRRIEHSVEMAAVGDDAAAGALQALADAAEANGDVAAVLAAVDAAETPAAAVSAAAQATGADQAPDRSVSRRVLDALRAAADGGASMADVRRAALRAASRLPGPPRLGRLPASVAYRASAGDVLDAIAWRRYGRESAVADLLAAGASRLPAELAAGDLVGLPADPVPAAAARRIVQLWT